MFCHIPESYPSSFSFTIISNLLNCYYSPYTHLVVYLFWNNSTSVENIIFHSTLPYHVPFKLTKENRQIFCTIWKSNFIFKVNQKWCIIHLQIHYLISLSKFSFSYSRTKNMKAVNNSYIVHYLLIPTFNFIICLSWVHYVECEKKTRETGIHSSVILYIYSIHFI